MTGIIKFIIKLLLLYTAINVFVILFFRFLLPPVSAYIYINTDENLQSLFTLNDIRQILVALDKISDNTILAVVASEDQRFFEHFGFDFQQIEKAMKENVVRKRIRGASTISMQTARNMFLWSGKNFLRKAIEAYYTLLLELCWSKSRIIEVYLNIAEMGNGIYGVGAASRIYFGKSPLKLTPSEAASLAAVLPNPKKRDPRKPSSYLLKRKSQILEQMNLLGGTRILKPYLN